MQTNNLLCHGVFLLGPNVKQWLCKNDTKQEQMLDYFVPTSSTAAMISCTHYQMDFVHVALRACDCLVMQFDPILLFTQSQVDILQYADSQQVQIYLICDNCASTEQIQAALLQVQPLLVQAIVAQHVLRSDHPNLLGLLCNTPSVLPNRIASFGKHDGVFSQNILASSEELIAQVVHMYDNGRSMLIRVFAGNLQLGQNTFYNNGAHHVIVESIQFGDTQITCAQAPTLVKVTVRSSNLNRGCNMHVNYKLAPIDACPTNVHMSIVPKIASNLPHLVEFLKHVAHRPDLTIYIEETGEYAIAASKSATLVDFQKTHKCPIDVSFSPIKTQLRESISSPASQTILAKSPNKHSRYFFTAEPTADALIKEFEKGILHQMDIKPRAKILADKFGWDAIEARKIWAISSNVADANILVDTTKGVQYLNEIKDATNSAFAWATKAGVFCEEPMRGITFRLLDVVLQSDSIHRGAGQIIPPVRRAMYGCQIASNPVLQKPLTTVTVTCPKEEIYNMYTELLGTGAIVVNMQDCLVQNLPYLKMNVHVDTHLAHLIPNQLDCSDKVIWKVIGNPMKEDSVAYTVMCQKQQEKGLKIGIPELQKYCDKL